MTLTTREKIIASFVLGAVILWLFNIFLYGPKKKELAQEKEELITIQQGINQMINLSQESKKLEAELAILRDSFRAFNEKLTSGRNITPFIKILASETNRLNIKVISMVPQEERLDPSARQFKSYLIDLRLVSGYKELVQFLDRRKELPITIMIEGFNIEKTEKETGEMKMDLKVRVCFSQGE